MVLRLFLSPIQVGLLKVCLYSVTYLRSGQVRDGGSLDTPGGAPRVDGSTVGWDFIVLFVPPLVWDAVAAFVDAVRGSFLVADRTLFFLARFLLFPLAWLERSRSPHSQPLAFEEKSHKSHPCVVTSTHCGPPPTAFGPGGSRPVPHLGGAEAVK